MPRLPRIYLYALIASMCSAGYGIVFTLLDNYRNDDHISSTVLGLVIGTGFASGFVAQVALAPLADRGHAKRLVVIGTTVYILGLVGMGFAHQPWSLIAMRFVTGTGFGMVAPAIRRIVILTDHANVGRNLGRLMAFEVAGFAAGPALAAITVGPWGVAAPYLITAAITTVVAVPAWFDRVKESVEPSERRFAFDLLRLRPFAAAAAFGSAVYLMIGAFDALWSLSLDDLHADEKVANFGITMFALPLVILGTVGGKLAQRYGPYRFGTAGLSLAIVCMSLYGLMPTAALMLTVAMIHSVGDGLTVASSSVAVAMVVPENRLAGAQGVIGGAQSLIGGFTAPLIGVIYDHHGRTVGYLCAAAGMVVLTTIGVVLARPVWSMRGSAGRSLQSMN